MAIQRNLWLSSQHRAYKCRKQTTCASKKNQLYWNTMLSYIPRRTPALVLGPYYADHGNQERGIKIGNLNYATSNSYQARKKRKLAKELEKKGAFGMNYVLMLCREEETWREAAGETGGGKKYRMKAWQKYDTLHKFQILWCSLRNIIKNQNYPLTVSGICFFEDWDTWSSEMCWDYTILFKKILLFYGHS